MIIDTERLLLRPLLPEDLKPLVALWTDPEVTQYMGGPRKADFLLRTFTDDLNNSNPSPFDLWPVIEKASGTAVGYCGLLTKEVEEQSEVELIFTFARNAWGLGYAVEISEALIEHGFKRLGLKRLIALINPSNRRAKVVARKLGMKMEKETVRPGGTTMHLYALEAG